MEVGEIHKTKNWGDVEIISKRGNKVDIKFLNTGHIKNNVKENAITIGMVEDSELRATGFIPETYRKNTPSINVGDIYPTNTSGSLKIIQIHGSRDVEVFFLDSGNIKRVQKHAILSGQVKDVEGLAEKARKEAEITKQIVEEQRKIYYEQRAKEMESMSHRLEKEQEEKRLRKEVERQTKLEFDKCNFNSLVGKIDQDNWGMSFTIVEALFDQNKYLVRYEKSGNEYSISSGRVQDDKHGLCDKNSEEYKIKKREHHKISSAKRYLENREENIKQASEWQKNNPERAQHRNRKRRAKIKNAEGSHTLEEIDEMLEKQQGLCACCGVTLGDRYGKHLDHIMPIVLGGRNSIDNLQWLCQFCNLSKNAKHPDEWEEYKNSEIFATNRNIRLTQQDSVT